MKEPDGFDDGHDDDDFADEDTGNYGGGLDDDRGGCVLGADCLHPDPFHTSAECFDVEMAEAHMAPEES